jgi:hypothetical protein
VYELVAITAKVLLAFGTSVSPVYTHSFNRAHHSRRRSPSFNLFSRKTDGTPMAIRNDRFFQYPEKAQTI